MQDEYFAKGKAPTFPLELAHFEATVAQRGDLLLDQPVFFGKLNHLAFELSHINRKLDHLLSLHFASLSPNATANLRQELAHCYLSTATIVGKTIPIAEALLLA